MNKLIELWYTNGERREFSQVDSLTEAKNECRKLTLKGYSNFTVDVFYKDSDGELVESKSRWYKWREGKLVSI